MRTGVRNPNGTYGQLPKICDENTDRSLSKKALEIDRWGSINDSSEGVRLQKLRNILILFLFLVSACHGVGEPSAGSSPNPPSPATNPPPPLPPPPSVRFFAFGDWGVGDLNQQAVADQTQSLCQQRGCDFGLLLGDNFYDFGVSSMDDPQWQNKFTDVYQGLDLPFYAVLGNHDWDAPANPDAQVAFSFLDPAKDARWKLPAYHYSFTYPQGTSPLVEIFVINSNQFDIAEGQWLEKALASSTANWKLLAFHHPIWTNGTAHVPDEKGIYPALKPIICGKIDMLLAGHDHFFSHLQDSSDGCGYDQVVIGTGGRSLYPSQPVTGSFTVFFTESNYGLGYFEIGSSQLTLSFVRADGVEAYRVSFFK